MRIYTELSLGKTDPGLREPDLPYEIGKAPEHAALVESLGFDGVVAVETKDDPFMLMALAATTTDRLQLATSVAIAFPRAPFITAMSAWRLQILSRGRFTLGLGPQVRGHLIRRYGLEVSPIGPWMRDYIGAVRALWDCWQNGGKLDYQSDRYKLDLTVPLFDPGPSDWPDVPIHLAAVNTYMCRVAGEVADGLRPHPICTPRYINEVMKPAVADGAEQAGRDVGEMAVAMKPLVATAPDEETLQARIRDVRARVAFYASTPAYRPAFTIWGLEDLSQHLAGLSRDQKWEEMPPLITDDILNTYAVVGTHDEIAGKILDRYAGVVTDVGFSIVVEDEADEEKLKDMVKRVQNG
ncbi:MAG: TIGR03617 family F420-dependent LLM class oxidoreductase [Alphaproteobacteria bacterium]|jgi:probable F420-dependent oxidoreductase|nr:TIGR03617 family F420-dependent LLM class oxidoreductase [Alphaproteobacteria bacterium]MDP6814948.1 TIGR03617 family F420-dependent LLM class oxidoreductase [Alphaproteobacteria bacterium]